MALLILLAAFSSERAALAEDPRVEAAAQDATTKAEQDYEAKALGKALYRLGKALHACGKTRCTDATVASLLRDAGSIHVRQRDRKGAARLFARAVGLVPTLELTSPYDSPDVRAVWEEAGGAKKPEPPAPAPPAPPPLAIAPAPAAEQPAGTPLPVLVEGGPPNLGHVAAESGAAKPAESEAQPARAPEPRHRARRLWIGVAGSIDFMDVPSGDDLCLRNAATGRPTNGSNLYCTTLDGKDFPPPSVINGTLGDIVPGQGQGGHSDGGLQLGDVRYLAAVDYALTPNALLGARVGFVTNRYQGNDAVRDKRAFGPILHAELRASWVFGHEPLTGTNVAPVVFVAGGVSEFDAQVKSSATITQGSPPSQTHLVVPVNIWHTDGPGFVGAGLGLRLTVGGLFAVTPAVRGSLAFGGNGVVPVFGPELTVQLGF